MRRLPQHGNPDSPSLIVDAMSPRVRREDLDALMDGYVRRRRPLQRAMVGVGFCGLALPTATAITTLTSTWSWSARAGVLVAGLHSSRRDIEATVAPIPGCNRLRTLRRSLMRILAAGCRVERDTQIATTIERNAIAVRTRRQCRAVDALVSMS
jgi:hypothetical protein